jgi:hypothetical protein
MQAIALMAQVAVQQLIGWRWVSVLTAHQLECALYAIWHELGWRCLSLEPVILHIAQCKCLMTVRMMYQCLAI